MVDNSTRPIIIKRKKVVAGGGHHGGAWKVAYADFVSAMMAFFMLMWLLTACLLRFLMRLISPCISGWRGARRRIKTVMTVPRIGQQTLIKRSIIGAGKAISHGLHTDLSPFWPSKKQPVSSSPRTWPQPMRHFVTVMATKSPPFPEIALTARPASNNMHWPICFYSHARGIYLAATGALSPKVPHDFQHTLRRPNWLELIFKALRVERSSFDAAGFRVVEFGMLVAFDGKGSIARAMLVRTAASGQTKCSSAFSTSSRSG